MKTAMITGASTGIGRATALLFHSRGWMVAATMRDPARAALPEDPRLRRYAMDVTDAAAVSRTVAIVERECGPIDVLVNNAGVYTTGPIEHCTEADYAAVFGTNVEGMLRVTQAVLPLFRLRRTGVVVNVSSVAGRTTFPFQSLYHGSKWAVEGLTEGMAHELRALGIRVKLVEPGMVKTPLYDETCAQADNRTVATDYRGNLAAWRRYLLANIAAGTGPEASARAIYRASTSGGHRLRYAAGADTRLAFALRAILPGWAWSALVRRLTGVRG